MQSQNKFTAQEMGTESECHWKLNLYCNLNCYYCFDGSHFNTECTEVGLYSPKTIGQAFEKIVKNSIVYLSGGEPFFYPNFIALCEELTKNQFIGISSNLSNASLLYELIKSIDPNRLLHPIYTYKKGRFKQEFLKGTICASLHATSREKKGESIKQFIDKILMIRKYGFNAVVRLVSHPLELERFPLDIRQIIENEIDFEIQIFRGYYKRMLYPEDFTLDQRRQIKSWMKLGVSQLPLFEYPKLKNKKCIAGKKLFYIDPMGNIFRCASYKNFFKGSMGNLFKGEIELKWNDNYCRIPEGKYCPVICLKGADREE